MRNMQVLQNRQASTQMTCMLCGGLSGGWLQEPVSWPPTDGHALQKKQLGPPNNVLVLKHLIRGVAA